jgi:hypothetical protein
MYSEPACCTGRFSGWFLGVLNGALRRCSAEAWAKREREREHHRAREEAAARRQEQREREQREAEAAAARRQREEAPNVRQYMGGELGAAEGGGEEEPKRRRLNSGDGQVPWDVGPIHHS